jgi:GTP pyrophosphokinase
VVGDDIVGFVTRGTGVSVHRADCPNVADLRTREGRMIDVEWDTDRVQMFQVEIVVEAADRTRLLVDVSLAINDTGGNILSSGTRTDRHTGISYMRFLVELADVGKLDAMLVAIRRVPDVHEARRALPGEPERKGRGRGGK